MTSLHLLWVMGTRCSAQSKLKLLYLLNINPHVFGKLKNWYCHNDTFHCAKFEYTQQYTTYSHFHFLNPLNRPPSGDLNMFFWVHTGVMARLLLDVVDWVRLAGFQLVLPEWSSQSFYLSQWNTGIVHSRCSNVTPCAVATLWIWSSETSCSTKVEFL